MALMTNEDQFPLVDTNLRCSGGLILTQTHLREGTNEDQFPLVGTSSQSGAMFVGVRVNTRDLPKHAKSASFT